MESVLVNVSRLAQKNKWVYSAHSLRSLRIEKSLASTEFRVVRVGALVEEIADGLHGVRNYVDDGVVMLAVGNIVETGLDLSEKRMVTSEEHERLARSQVNRGDVLVTITGRLGSALVYESIASANLSAHVARIKVKASEVNASYFVAYLNSAIGQQLVHEFSIGSIYPHINVSRLKNVRVILPPREVQDRIAGVMQAAYASRREKLTAADTLLDSIEGHVLELLGIEAKATAYQPRFQIKRSELHRADVRFFLPHYLQLEKAIASGKYPTRPLAQLCRKLTNGLTPAREAYTEEGRVVVKVASMSKGWRVDWGKVAYTSEEIFQKATKAHLSDGDIVILAASHQLDYVGKSFALVRDMPAEMQGKCMAVGELIIARANENVILPEFLVACFAVQPIQELINRMTRGQSAHLYASDLGELQIPLPPIELQQTIANEITRRRADAKRLRAEAEAGVAQAKAQVERLILGEDLAA